MQLIERKLLSIAAMPPMQIRAAIQDMQEYILADKAISLSADNFPLQHTFAPGCYMRTMLIPKGSLVIGKIHKHAHGNVLSQGLCWVITEGVGGEELQGPITFTSEPGAKRLVYVKEDVVWTTIHVTDKTDIAEIERDIIAKDYSEIEIIGQFRREE